MSTNLVLKSWACPNCPYYQQFDPTDLHLVVQNFPECPDLPLGKCPACWMGKNPQKVKQTSEMGLMLSSEGSRLQSNVASDDVLEAKEVPDTDQDGQPIMVQTGERYELRVNQSTGEIYSEPVPVYEPKMRSLTPQELAELKTQRDQNLDALEAVAVKEVTETKQK